MSGAVAATYGLAFSISPAPKKKPSKSSNKDEDDDEYILTLAPFTRVPKINFGEVKVNTLVERILLISNPQEFTVRLNVTNQDLDINNMEIDIPRNTQVDFKIRWQPEKPGQYKYAITFELIEGAKLKFLVHAFGICKAPPPPKKVVQIPRKPLAMLQPLKREKSTLFNEPTNKAKPSAKTTKENHEGLIKKSISTTFIKASVQPSYSRPLKEQRPSESLKATTTSKLAMNRFDDLYKSFSGDEDFEITNLDPSIVNLRRQTSILASPSTKYQPPVYVKTEEHKTPLRRSISASSISSPTSFIAAGGLNLNQLNSPSVASTAKSFNKPILEETRKATDLTPQLNDFLKPSKSKFVQKEAESKIAERAIQSYSMATPQMQYKKVNKIYDIYALTPNFERDISAFKYELAKDQPQTQDNKSLVSLKHKSLVRASKLKLRLNARLEDLLNKQCIYFKGIWRHLR